MNDGGPAFPRAAVHPECYSVDYEGISVLDYFAGQALSGMSDEDFGREAAEVASWCYQVAQHMITRARTQKRGALMTDTPIKPCPDCGGEAHVIDKVVVWVACKVCSLGGPYSNTTVKLAVDMRNALPRREDFYAELVKLSEFFDAGWGEQALDDLLEELDPERKVEDE